MKAKKKPYRSVVSNALWSLSGMLKATPTGFLLLLLLLPINLFLAWADIYLPSLVVAQVTAYAAPRQAILRVAAFLFLMFAADALQKIISAVSGSACELTYRHKRSLELDEKSLRCFYETYEKKESRDLYDRALRSTQMWGGSQPISDMVKRSLKLLEYVLGYLLFGTVISFVSPWLLPLLTLAPAVNWFSARALRNWEYSHREKWTDIDHRLWYIQNRPGDFSAAKDIRIYSMAGWFRQIYRDLSDARTAWDRRLSLRSFLSRIADLFVILLRDGIAYAMLISMALGGEIAVDRFVLYFSAISAFAACVGNIMNEINAILSASLMLCDFREYMDLAEHDGTGKAAIEEHLNAAPTITFDHVSFRYAGALEDTIRDLSFTVKAGEKIALVGANGAGKTTLVKLLCGLYRPTAGEIRIDGVPVEDFSRNDYYRLFSPVFQDVTTAFFSLAETVAGQVGEGVDPKRAQECMKMAGLGKKLDSLPEGVHTKLDKQINENGIELSGGELQKLMLARALYKDAPILVLDEPTAALDPIAENQIYLQYQSMTARKTSLFVSHRLASTRFCDRILYLENGKIAEEGTHEELIRLGGEYSRLFAIQSCWYQEEKSEN